MGISALLQYWHSSYQSPSQLCPYFPIHYIADNNRPRNSEKLKNEYKETFLQFQFSINLIALWTVFCLLYFFYLVCKYASFLSPESFLCSCTLSSALVGIVLVDSTLCRPQQKMRGKRIEMTSLLSNCTSNWCDIHRLKFSSLH